MHTNYIYLYIPAFLNTGTGISKLFTTPFPSFEGRGLRGGKPNLLKYIIFMAYLLHISYNIQYT